MPEELSYFEERMQLLGITEELNQISLWQNVENENVLQPFPIFRETERGIEILVYSIDRCKIPYAKEGSRWRKNDFCITRLKEPEIRKNGEVMKYQLPRGAGTFPFFPPPLVDKYDAGTPIETLFLTEGYFKAFKGAMHGVDIVGLSSITHMKEKDKGTLHGDIVQLMKKCQVKRVVWLTDGDALDITKKDLDDGVDLSKRPVGFYKSAVTFKQLMEDKQLMNEDLEKYFVHVDSENISGKPKGLDDLLCTLPDKVEDITSELCNVSRENGTYFWKCNITFGLSRLYKHFMLHSINEFYEYHAQRRPEIRQVAFYYNGTQYRYDEKSAECKIEVPASSKNYFRVGDNYYEFVKIPNKYNQLEHSFHRRLKTTITDDHGKGFINHISKYIAFCNVPNHVNYEQVIHRNFNTYHPFEWEPEAHECTEEDFPTIHAFIKHIFGTTTVKFKNSAGKEITMPYYHLAYDYIQLLYQQPTHVLPILCLVSKENETGKSTFAKFLKMIFTQNVAIVGNADLADNFNAHWATRLLVICDETKIDKQSVVEKVKSLSTADKIMMNAKGRDHVEIDCFLKFIFITNNEDNFIYATEDDLRYWIVKVPVLKEKIPHLEMMFKDEIPAFMSFLSRRPMATELRSRMWFDPALLKTEALKKVIQHSKPTFEKEIRLYLKDLFLDFGVQEVLMSRKDIHKEVFNCRGEINYVERVIKDNLRPEQHKTVTRYSYPRWDQRMAVGGKMETVRVDVRCSGRPFIFHREDYLNPEEAALPATEQTPPDPEELNMYTEAPLAADTPF